MSDQTTHYVPAATEGLVFAVLMDTFETALLTGAGLKVADGSAAEFLEAARKATLAYVTDLAVDRERWRQIAAAAGARERLLSDELLAAKDERLLRQLRDINLLRWTCDEVLACLERQGITGAGRPASPGRRRYPVRQRGAARR